jgi:hypothetical protein
MPRANGAEALGSVQACGPLEASLNPGRSRVRTDRRAGDPPARRVVALVRMSSSVGAMAYGEKAP